MISIRQATLGDVSQLHALIESAYRGDSARAGWTHEADLLGGQRTDEKALTAIMSDPLSAILIAEDGGLRGCVQIVLTSTGLGYLGLLAVSPVVQAGGIGSRLIAAAETTLASKFAAIRIEMTVIKRRAELIGYYERRGYAKTGEVRPFPYDDERSGIAQSDDLDFVVLEKTLYPAV
jgi:predicted N-acetyltransferase YhbS